MQGSLHTNALQDTYRHILLVKCGPSYETLLQHKIPIAYHKQSLQPDSFFLLDIVCLITASATQILQGEYLVIEKQRLKQDFIQKSVRMTGKLGKTVTQPYSVLPALSVSSIRHSYKHLETALRRIFIYA